MAVAMKASSEWQHFWTQWVPAAMPLVDGPVTGPHQADEHYSQRTQKGGSNSLPLDLAAEMEKWKKLATGMQSQRDKLQSQMERMQQPTREPPSKRQATGFRGNKGGGQDRSNKGGKGFGRK